jgi:Flp pilus assembly protein TadD
VLLLSPSNSKARGQYAGLLARTGNWERAVAVGRETLEIDPTWLGVRRLLADAYRETGRLSESRQQLEILKKFDGARDD